VRKFDVERISEPKALTAMPSTLDESWQVVTVDRNTQSIFESGARLTCGQGA
jgi:hypothetical protein